MVALNVSQQQINQIRRFPSIPQTPDSLITPLWSSTPNFSLLYGSLSDKDAAEVIQALDSAGILYRVEHDTGAVLVPSSQLHEARLKLAGGGLPRGTDMGFGMLEKKRSFGTSQFIEQKRYQRALEVELARSIASLSNVQTARVHLALPTQSAFLRNQKKASASVLIRLYPGRQLEEGEGEAIAHLVAAGIPGLKIEGVQVIDERGRLLTSGDGNSPIGLSNRQFQYVQKFEAAYIETIEGILSPMVGADGVRAQVTAEVDFTRSEQARESFTPNKEAVRSERVLEEKGGSLGAGGIPGALSNQPPGGAQAPESLDTDNPEGVSPATEQSRSRRQSTINYELDRIVDHTVTPSYTLKKLSVAVVVDDKVSVNDAGEAVRAPLTDEELASFTNLVKNAIGYDEERGDTVTITNSAFLLPEAPPEELPEEPIWKQAWVLDLAKQAGGGLLVLILAFGLLRPMMKNLVNRDLAELEMHQAAQQARLTQEAQVQRALPEASVGADGAIEHIESNASLDSIRALAAEDPKRVANVVRTWVENG